MNFKDSIKTQFGFFYRTVELNLEGVTEQHSLHQPSPGGNCTNWILAHIVDAQNGCMGLVGADPVTTDPAIGAVGHEPITSVDRAVDWDSMVSSMLGSKARFLEALDGLTDEQLDEGGFTDPFGNSVTRAELLNLLAVHQNYHAGQLGLSRRLAGLPGAVRQPRPEAAQA